jgi:formylglycine-generating enzyme
MVVEEPPAPSAAPAPVPSVVENKPGYVYRDPATGMEFVFVKGGCFQMGDLWGDGTEDEKPVHDVCVDDFYIGKYEVTMGQFKKFRDETGYRTDGEKGGYGCTRTLVNEWDSDPKTSWYSPGFSQTEDHPVVCVSSDDAETFIGWMSRKEGRIFRLPTEAEWEYAARSRGKNYKYSWGNGVPSGNIADESLKKVYPECTIWNGYNDGYVYTAPVGKFKPNDLGLYDMAGNVWEFCSDYYEKDYYTKSPRNNPSAPRSKYKEGVGHNRSVRGGAWSSIPHYIRLASRAFFDPQPYINYDTGFRLIMLVK